MLQTALYSSVMSVSRKGIPDYIVRYVEASRNGKENGNNRMPKLLD